MEASLSLFFLVLLPALAIADLSCELQTGLAASDFSLSAEAIAAIQVCINYFFP